MDIHAPAPLRDIPLWLVWRLESALDGGKPLKVPYYPRGGRRHGKQGSDDDRSKLTTFAVAKVEAAKRGMAGIGFATLDGDVCALDFDNCVVDGKVDSAVLKAIGATYAEFSPSGRGVRAVVRGDLGNRKAPTTDTEFGFETFSTTGFVTVTGNMLPHVDLSGLEDTIGPVTAEVEQMCERRFGSAKPKAVDPDDFMAGREPKIGLTEERMRELVGKIDPDLGRDEWIRVGMALHHETDGGEEGFDLWNEWSSEGYKYPSEEALRGQWDSFERRRGSVGRQVTMASVIKLANAAAPASVDDIVARADAIVAASEPTAVVGTPEGWEGKFPAAPFGKIAMGKPVEWLIKGVLPAADLVAIYGPSGAGKSFVALDLAAAIARGVPWRGRRTIKTRVLVIAAEGAGGYASRAQALASQWCVEPSDFDIAIVTARPNVMQEEDITELVATAKAVGNVGLIIIDTLAQVTPGANENTSEDMGLALSHCHTLSRATGATIALVHHSGKDLSRGARGWSGFKAAMDAEIEVTRDPETDAREIVIRKQKDGRDGERFGFKLETVVLGLDRDGDEITSCIVVPVAEVQKRVEMHGKKRGHLETHLLEVMTFFAGDNVVSVEDFLRKAVDTFPAPEAGKRDVRRQNLTRALAAMGKEKDAPLRVDGGIVIFYE
jgi:hypothetical protein